MGRDNPTAWKSGEDQYVVLRDTCWGVREANFSPVTHPDGSVYATKSLRLESGVRTESCVLGPLDPADVDGSLWQYVQAYRARFARA